MSKFQRVKPKGRVFSQCKSPLAPADSWPCPNKALLCKNKERGEEKSANQLEFLCLPCCPLFILLPPGCRWGGISSPLAWVLVALQPLLPQPLARRPLVCVPVLIPALVVVAGWEWLALHSPWRCWVGPSAACLSVADLRKTSVGLQQARPHDFVSDVSSRPRCLWNGPPAGCRGPWRAGAEAGTPLLSLGRQRCPWMGLRPRSLDPNHRALQSALQSCWREERGSRLAAGIDSPVHHNILSELLE